MAQKSGFFNAKLVNGVYDRTYNANDYSDNLAVVIGNGVLRSENDDLKVYALAMTARVSAGRAWINGHYYLNDSDYTFTVPTAPTGGTRWDRVMLRLDKSIPARNVSLVYVEGTAANEPTKPAPIRTDTIYDLVLADIYVGTNANYCIAYDTRDDAEICGWVYSTSGDNSFFTSLDNSFNTWFQDKKDTLSSVTLFKKYTFTRKLSAPTSRASFTIPQYDPETCFLEIYVNGIYETRYTIERNSVAVFQGTLTAGTTIEFNCYKSIDGTGIMSVADEITELQDQMETVIHNAKYTYKCTGTDDNISLSQIADAIYNGSYVAADVTAAAKAFLEGLGANFFTNLSSNAKVTIEVEGENLSATTPYAGSGTTASRYRWFGFGQTASSNRKVIFDFAKTNNITITPTANTDNIVFYGTDLNIKNANVNITTAVASCVITMIEGSYDTGNICVEDSNFLLDTTGKATFATNGTFINCKVKMFSTTDHCLIFVPTTDSLIRVIGGSFLPYYKASGKTAATFYTYGTATNAVIIAQNISCPTISVTGYSQLYLSVGYAGSTQINGVVSTMTSQGTYNTITGQIWKSKR